jgi:DnaJ-class molecular chaperone
MEGSDIRALARMLDRVDYYRLLRIERDAQAHEVRSAYQAMRREFHPDRHRAGDEDTREAVDQIAKRLNESYSVLRDASRRNAYDHGLEDDRLRYTPETADEVKEETQAASGATPSGRKFFALAREDELRGDTEKAHANVKMAMTFEPSNPYFKAKLEELTAKLPKKDAKSSFAIR